MPTATRAGRGLKEYPLSVLNDLKAFLSGPVPQPDRVKGKDIIKAVYHQIEAWRDAGLSFEEIATKITEKVPTFTITGKVLRRYMIDASLKVSPEISEDIPKIDPPAVDPKPRRVRNPNGKGPAKNTLPPTSGQLDSQKPTDHEPPAIVVSPKTPQPVPKPKELASQFNPLSDDLPEE